MKVHQTYIGNPQVNPKDYYAEGFEYSYIYSFLNTMWHLFKYDDDTATEFPGVYENVSYVLEYAAAQLEDHEHAVLDNVELRLLNPTLDLLNYLHTVITNEYRNSMNDTTMTTKNAYKHTQNVIENYFDVNILNQICKNLQGANQQKISAADLFGSTSTRQTFSSDGGSSDYYKLPAHASELRHLISYKGMSFARGNIFKALYRLGEKEGVGLEYDLKKIKFFAEEMLDMHARGEKV